jgi:hypothetical protein
MPAEDDFPSSEIEHHRRGWKIAQVHADGQRSFLRDRRFATEDEARAFLEKALPRMRRVWDRLTDHPAL